MEASVPRKASFKASFKAMFPHSRRRAFRSSKRSVPTVMTATNLSNAPQDEKEI